MSHPVINYEKCKVAKKCLEVCPMNVFELQEDKMVVARPQDCIGCKACESNCPEQAIIVEDD